MDAFLCLGARGVAFNDKDLSVTQIVSGIIPNEVSLYTLKLPYCRTPSKPLGGAGNGVIGDREHAESHFNNSKLTLHR